KTGPLLYKLKKPPRTILSQLECSSVVRYNKGASLRKSTPVGFFVHLSVFSSSATTCSVHFVALAYHNKVGSRVTLSSERNF
ncbi:hypothetical protein, partial [Faecalibacterium prausnitzii]|uniref:hypothetical protein n=2 Tax=Faecalibacterium prausnitzii TaxID=853 RepID=UPI001F3451AF